MTPVRKRRPVVPALIAAIVGAAIAGGATLLSSVGGAEPAGRGGPVAIASSYSMMEDEVVDLVNEQRAKAGCEPLAVDPQLVDAAEAHSTDMAERGYFGHTTPEGLTFRDRILSAGFSSPGTGENLAHGQRDAGQVVASWMASEGHRANILNCEFTRVGVGLAEDGMYWTQDFGKV